MRLVLALLLAVNALFSSAQSVLTGHVVDAKTQEPLAFVPINIAGTNQGTVSDIDGRFKLEVPGFPVDLRLSYVGYNTLEVTVGDASPLTMRLQQSNTELRPVVVSGADNPAHRIIRRAYANRKESDGMRYRSYRFASYSKTVFDLALDSAITNDTARMAKLDTSQREVYEFSEKQHLLLIESATKKSFIPPANAREEVLAMRVSGLKDPSLLALAAQTETFSIYDPQIMISEKSYLGPLGPSSTSKYRFNLEDTLYQGPDSVYVISYRPRKGTKFNGLKGLLYINTDGYAVQNVTAEPVEREGLSVRFQQLHERVFVTDPVTGAPFMPQARWFPKQLNTFLYLDKVSVNGASVFGTGRTYLKDIEVDANVARKEVRGPDFVADRMDVRRDDAYWDTLRVEPLGKKDLKTYAVIDSIGDSLHFDRKLKWFTALTTGRLPIGPVDLVLARILNYNGYEGLRLGAGLATNDRISRHGSIGGYFGYGFKDHVWKYGGDLTIKPLYGRDMDVRFSYENDVSETGGVKFEGPTAWISSENIRQLYMDRMDRTERFAATVKFRIGSAVKLWLGSERTQRVNVIGYKFVEHPADGITTLRNDFLIGAITADLRWAFREKMARLPGRELSLGTKYPVVHLHALRAWKGLWEGEVGTWRLDAMVEKTFHIRLVGDLSLRVLGGIADPGSPMPFLYNMRGTNGAGQFLISADNTFETMRPDEFMADRYLSLHMRHSFGTLLVKGKHFHPKPAILSSAAFGELAHPEYHRGLSFTPLKEGFFESGLRIDDIFSTIGAGIFYRYGPYTFTKASDNFVLKLSASFAL